MTNPQPGIFIEGSPFHQVQEYDVDHAADVSSISTALSDLRAGMRSSSDDVSIVVGFGSELAARLSIETPSGFRSFETVGSGAFTAPTTQHDVLVWVHGHTPGDVFDAALMARRALEPAAAAALNTSGFVYHDSRDLTGFIDGTENPAVDEAVEVALVGDDDQGSGGSILLAQKWVHDLDGFHALPVAEQEGAIGRTKPDSVELAEDDLPDSAHIARVVMEDDEGEEIEIYRRSVPFAENNVAGLLFLGFSNELTKLDDMVQAMFGVPDGIRDRLVEFSRASSSGYYFVPADA